MATADTACICGCARACHRRAQEWGTTVYGPCRHCAGCERFAVGTPTPTAATVGPVVLSAYDAWACEACGARYGRRFDHECGPLTPVVVTVTRREITRPAPADRTNH